MEQVKEVVKDHLEKHKFFDSLKSAVSKDPKLNKLDRNQIIEKLKSEGILNDILQGIPHNKKSGINQSSSISDLHSKTTSGLHTVTPGKRKIMSKEGLDPNKRYLNLHVIKGSAFLDFVNVRQDEHI